MYRRGNGQGADYRFRLNSWPHSRAKRMLEYKAAWNGVTIIQLTKSDTYGSSSRCPACGEKLRSPTRGDVGHKRMLWCPRCKVWMDRDVIAALNLSQRGRLRFDRSLSFQSEMNEESRLQPATPLISEADREEGLASEAVTWDGTKTLIHRVDASKLATRREPKSWQNSSRTVSSAISLSLRTRRLPPPRRCRPRHRGRGSYSPRLCRRPPLS
jgi:Zn-finger nucleic acid-binding protein